MQNLIIKVMADSPCLLINIMTLIDLYTCTTLIIKTMNGLESGGQEVNCKAPHTQDRNNALKLSCPPGKG